MMRPAIFLDRDGTLVEPRHYPRRAEQLTLYDGIAEPLRRLRESGFALVVVTNQSGIARDLFSEADLQAMHDDLRGRLHGLGVAVDAIHYCPHHPDGVVAEFAYRCGCRKPMPGMLLRAAADLDLDLARSWMIGDILDDIEAGHRAGCHSILVDLGTEPLPASPLRAPDFVGRDTSHALAIVAGIEGLGPDADVAYRPAGWRLPSVRIASYSVVDAGGAR
ncbi:MAG TPA: HAD family hydrolase [Thermomicrobiales bacterium]|jgi:D-glycero-D-manno-heptose 1,7-bisphosphate phosphatase|nr:HAD family hydrolase [Thermomicrobiales bacterium]